MSIKQTSLIDSCLKSWTGRTSEDKKRLYAVLMNPTPETWDAAYDVQIGSGGMLTLSSAINTCTCSGHRYLPRYNDELTQRIWDKIPSQFEIAMGMRFAAQLRETLEADERMEWLS